MDYRTLDTGDRTPMERQMEYVKRGIRPAEEKYELWLMSGRV